MKSVIIKPKNKILEKYVQYFLFFRKADNHFLNYTTFPNSNLCLAIYKENKINYIYGSANNTCLITPGRANFISRLYGFHKMPFNVTINGDLDQVCIIFYPGALRSFTQESYDDLMRSDSVFNLFSNKASDILEQLFDETDFSVRANQLESVLLANLNYNLPVKLEEALYLIPTYAASNLTVEALAKKMEISAPSLFRLFKNHLGQNPKSYLRTLRFRNVLDEIRNRQVPLTDITYSNQYYDQAHFIHDFKSFSGYAPGQLIDKISVQQNHLAWIYNKK